MDWGDLLNNAAKDAVVNAINPKPATPNTVATGGMAYAEGKPAAALPSATVASDKLFGLPKMVVIGGAAVAVIGLFLMMRK